MLVIRREGEPSLERAVRITRREDGKFWWMNPHAQIKRAAGIYVRRHGCIVSFAAGLRDAGYRVMIDERRKCQLKRKYEFTSPEITTYTYWLVGFAWGNSKWEALIKVIQLQVKQEFWYDAFQATAEYTYHHRYQKIRLVLPTSF
jgi:hypothetical protein